MLKCPTCRLLTSERRIKKIMCPLKEEVEIFGNLRLPKRNYETAAELVKIYDCANFDDYVSDIIKRDIEMLLDGAAPLDNQIHYKLTGKHSPYVQGINKQFRPDK